VIRRLNARPRARS